MSVISTQWWFNCLNNDGKHFSVTLVMFLRHTTAFLICCWAIVIGICSLLLYRAFRPVPVEERMFVCGNAIMENAHAGDTAFADGKAVFMSNCASCHNPIKDATGPALADIKSFRSEDWICRFLTEPRFTPNDKRAVNLRKSYGLKCMKFPQLSCEEVKALVRYAADHKRPFTIN